VRKDPKKSSSSTPEGEEEKKRITMVFYTRGEEGTSRLQG